VSLSSISGIGFGGLPTIGNREIVTTIRLKDGETNMLAGLIRDEERMTLNGVPGLSDMPLIGRLFAHNKRETTETDIILTLTPHIVRVLDVTEGDLRPFRLGRDSGAASIAEVLGGAGIPRDEPLEMSPSQPGAGAPRTVPLPPAAPPPAPAATPSQPSFPQPLQGMLPGVPLPISAPPVPKKPGGGS
jgi:general secretion pathway protein D